jgi:hypothetical protein
MSVENLFDVLARRNVINKSFARLLILFVSKSDTKHNSYGIYEIQ